MYVYATYGLYGGWVFHISQWYPTDSYVFVDPEVLYYDL